MKTILICLFAILPNLAGAQQGELDKKLRYAMNELQGEMITCVAYYRIGKECLGDKEPQLSRDMQTSTDHLIDLSGRVGKAIGLTDDAMLSRLKLSMKEQMSLMNNNCINIASLLERHAMRCKKVVQDADAILAEYLKQ